MQDGVIFFVQWGDGSYQLGTIPVSSLPSGVTEQANSLGRFNSPDELAKEISNQIQSQGQGTSQT